MIHYGILMLVPLAAGLAVGVTLADVDTVFKFLVHRSLITHSFLLPLGAFFTYRAMRDQRDWVRILVAGLCLGMAIHLSFDVFPVGWRGAALVHVPFYGRTGAVFSVVWMGLSMVVCFYIALHMMNNAVDVSVSAAALLVVFGFASGSERFLWQSFVVLVLTLVVALILPESRSAVLRDWYRSKGAAVQILDKLKHE